MSNCEDDRKTALHRANAAIGELFRICPNDDLLKPIIEPGQHPVLWQQFWDQFGDSGLWNNQPACTQAVFWQNYAQAMQARAQELSSVSKG